LGGLAVYLSAKAVRAQLALNGWVDTEITDVNEREKNRT
jgi:hypothetical protein